MTTADAKAGAAPQALLNPQALADLTGAFAEAGPERAQLGEELFLGLKTSLAGAIGDVFIVAFAAIVLALIATAFLRVVPLSQGPIVRQSRGRWEVAAETPAEQPGAASDG